MFWAVMIGILILIAVAGLIMRGRDETGSFDFLNDAGEDEFTPVLPKEKSTGTTEGDRVTACKTWQCPRCRGVLEKGALGIAIFPGQLTEGLFGEGRCTGCGAGFSQAEIYGGKYDYPI
ncbi:MAG TPA: hypothetical protein VFQ47_06680 [Nitrososphaera sp.]|jgi:hypothetical protein|nr:hypothetical protein [Nitrososphaera sp.]